MAELVDAGNNAIADGNKLAGSSPAVRSNFNSSRKVESMDSQLGLDFVIDNDFQFDEYVADLQIEVNECLKYYHAETVHDSVAIIKRLRERLIEAEKQNAR